MISALVVAFIFISLVCFGVFAFVTRPDQEQKAMQRRVKAIKTPQGEFADATESLENYLSQKPRVLSSGWKTSLTSPSSRTRCRF